MIPFLIALLIAAIVVIVGLFGNIQALKSQLKATDRVNEAQKDYIQSLETHIQALEKVNELRTTLIETLDQRVQIYEKKETAHATV